MRYFVYYYQVRAYMLLIPWSRASKSISTRALKTSKIKIYNALMEQYKEQLHSQCLRQPEDTMFVGCVPLHTRVMQIYNTVIQQ